MEEEMSLTFNAFKGDKWHELEIKKPDTMTEEDFMDFAKNMTQAFSSVPFIEPLLK